VPPSDCLTVFQKLRLAYGILTRLGARQGGHHSFFWFFFHPRYDVRYDLNHDGVISFKDLNVLSRIPTCRHR
jgi:hypothetical protein